ISNCGNQQNRFSDNLVLRCKLSQLFPIKENQATGNKIDCTVQNVCPSTEVHCHSICNVAFIKEVCTAYEVVDYATDKDKPCTLFVFQQKTEKRKEQVKHE